VRRGDLRGAAGKKEVREYGTARIRKHSEGREQGFTSFSLG